MVTIGFLRQAGLLEVGLPQIQKSEFYFFFEVFFLLTYGVTNLLKVMTCDLWRSRGRIFAHWTCLYFSLCLWVVILCRALIL